MKNTSSLTGDVPVKEDLEHYTVVTVFLRQVQYFEDGDDI